ncbi:MAG TPA: hypothetical protein PKU97_24850, partial [Kofleriaceae bacterium]|nr:hypothetical protein [Kofleriaceae bacterium]
PGLGPRARRPAAAYLPEATLGLAGLTVAALTASRQSWLAAAPLALFGLGLLWVALGSMRE